MKKKFAALFAVCCLSALLLSFTGCGTTNKAADPAGEKMLEKALVEKVEVEGDTVKFNGDDGQEVVVGKDEWPDYELAKKVPEFTKGTVATAALADDTVTIFLKQVKAGDFDDYLNEIKKTYSNDVYEDRNDAMVTYGGSDGDQISVAINYIRQEETMGITISKAEQ